MDKKEESLKLTDHRDIGRELDLFSFHDVSPGAVFWHGKGMVIWRELEKYLRGKLDQANYQEVSTPIMVKKELYETSGHWQHYRENGFTLEVDNQTYVLKPMNCPEACLIFKNTTRSYRDLPIKLSEITGKLHRKELSGVLGGLLRVRQMNQDDAHIFCREDQIHSAITEQMELVKEFYSYFDMPLSFNVATRPEDAMGEVKLWEKAEQILKDVLDKLEMKYEIKEKDGAFYGPKIDINVTDSQKREWTIATVQLDFQMPERFELEYTSEDGSYKRPVIIHRAIIGTFERFIGIITEHFAGAFPLWLSPVQVMVAPIGEKHLGYGKQIFDKLKAEGIRVEFDSNNETIGKKIRTAEMQKVPYILVIGDKEIEGGLVAVRKRGEGDLGTSKIDKFIDDIKKEIESKK